MVDDVEHIEVESPEPQSPAPAKKKHQFSWSMFFMIILLVIGVGLICYPSISDIWNRHVSSKAVATYVEATKDLTPQKREAMLEKARAYNAGLVGKGNARFIPNEEEKKQYFSTLDVTGTGIMAYVTIPKIHVRVPVYHGTSDTVLQIAAGHLEGTSFPIGGESTHVAVSGHTGLPSALLFTGLDQLKKGDRFSFTVFDEVLTYQVESIHVVEPTDVKPLAIEEGKDLASLITCTPYGVNSHRLIVTGHRIETPKAQERIQDKALTRDIMLTVFVIAVVALMVLLIFWMNHRRARKIRAQRAQNHIEQ